MKKFKHTIIIPMHIRDLATDIIQKDIHEIGIAVGDTVYMFTVNSKKDEISLVFTNKNCELVGE